MDPVRAQIRLPPFTAATDVDRLLDWAPGRRAATIEFGTGFFTGWTPTPAGADLLRFAAGVYCTDRTVPREPQPDGWTRTMQIDAPAHEPDRWQQADWPATLGFLSAHTSTSDSRRSDGSAITMSAASCSSSAV